MPTQPAIHGYDCLRDPHLNKGSAFSDLERRPYALAAPSFYFRKPMPHRRGCRRWIKCGLRHRRVALLLRRSCRRARPPAPLPGNSPKYACRLIKGGVDHNLSQETPERQRCARSCR